MFTGLSRVGHRIDAPSVVMKTVYWLVLVKRELSEKVNSTVGWLKGHCGYKELK